MNNKKLLLSILFSPLIFSNQCEEIELFFNAPMDGFKTNAKEFKVEFGSKNIQITPAGIEVEDRQSCIVGGHHHLIINNAYDVDKNIIILNQYIIYQYPFFLSLCLLIDLMKLLD